MTVEFISPEFEHLRSPYYDDFFFQNIHIINIETEEVILHSEFQGRFLQNIWDMLIEFERIEVGNKKLKQFGKMKYYKFDKIDTELVIQLAEEEPMTFHYESFYEAFYTATKRYLALIKRENPRVALDELYQQISASCYYFERNHEVPEKNQV